MAEDTTKPPAAPPADPMRDILFSRLFPEVEKSVDSGVENELNKVRNGDGSFWGFLKGLIFKLAEALGFAPQLANMFGMHIPDAKEKKALATQITSSVSDVLTAKDKDGNSLAAQMTPEQLHQAVASRVSYDLKHNKIVAAAFTPEQIAKAADKAGKNAEDKIDMIRGILSPPQPVATDVPLTGKPEEQVKQTLGSMADGILNGPLIPTEKRADAAALKPVMVDIGTKVVMAHPELIGKPDELAKLYADELQKSDVAKEGLKKLGMDISDPGTKTLVTQMLQTNLRSYGDTLAKATQGQAAGVKPPPPPQMDYRKLIADKVSENIKEQTAQAVLEKWNGGGAKGWYVKNDDVSKAAGILNKYNVTPPANEQEKTERQAAVQTLYQRAVDQGNAPNDDQRQKIGETVADATIATLKNPANRDLPQAQMADLLQSNVNDALIKATPAINGLGKSIEDINHRYVGDNEDLIGTISKGIGDKLRDVKDPDKLYDMLKIAQASLLGSDVASVATNSGFKGAAAGITGGQEAKDIVATATFGNSGKGTGGRAVGNDNARQPGTPGPMPLPGALV